MKKLLAIVLVFCLAVTLSACSTGGVKGELKVGLGVNKMPFEFQTEQGMKGISVDILKVLADKLSVQIKYENGDFDSVFGLLMENKIDVLTTDTFFSSAQDKKDKLDFSKPYFSSKQVLIIKEDSTISSLADILVGKKVGGIIGYEGERVCREDLMILPEDLKAYTNGTQAVADISAGTLDAFVVDLELAKELIKGVAGIKIFESEEFVQKENVFAVKKGNKKLLEKINRAIDESNLSEIVSAYK